MEEWKEYNIGQLCSSVCSGGTPSSKCSEYYDGDIPWLNTKEINFNRIYVTEKFITEEGFNNSSTKWIPEDSVIVAMYGATAGKAAITKIRLTTNQACCNLTINPEIADYRFVYYHLYNKFVELASLANGGAQQNLNAQVIKDFPIILPPLHEQKRIADILYSLDDKIEVNRRINDNLEQQAQALFKSWFVDFEPFKDHPFVESELGMIPQGWRVGSLGEYCRVRSGFAFKSTWWTNEGVPVIKIKNISESGTLVMSDCSYVSIEHAVQAKEFLTRVGDLLIAMTGATIGKFCIVHDNEEYCVNQRVGKFFLGDKPLIRLPFIYLNLKQSRIHDEIINRGQGSAQPNISGRDIETLSIILAPDRVLSSFNVVLFPLFKKIISNEQESRRLADLRNTLLPRLMSGELSVNDIKE